MLSVTIDKTISHDSVFKKMRKRVSTKTTLIEIMKVKYPYNFWAAFTHPALAMLIQLLVRQ